MSHAAKGKEGAKDARGDGVEISDTTEQFEEYTAPPRLDEHGNPVRKAKGLGASGYKFPPAGGPQPALTKENLAKGIGVPAFERPPAATEKPWPMPPLPSKSVSTGAAHEPATPQAPAPVVKVHEDPLFEEYQRPDLKKHPRTGSGLRTDPPPIPSAKELLEKYEPPVPEVHTPKRFSILPRRAGDSERTQQEDQAHLDAVADSLAAAAPDAVMSNPVANGPMKTVVTHPDDDLFAPAPEVPVAHPTPSPLPASATPPPAAPLPRPAAWGPAPSVTQSSAVPNAVRPALPSLHPSAAPHTTPVHPAAPPASAPTAAPASTAQAAPAPAAHAPHAAPVQAPSVPVAPAIAHPDQTKAGPAHTAQTHAPAKTGHATRHVPSTPHGSDAPAPAPGGPVPRIGLVQCDFNHAITTAMALSAHQEARRLGAPIAHHVHVPGVFDAPLAAKTLLERDDVDAVVVIGCVIQGETGHDEVITHAAAQTLLALACNSGKPVGLGVTGPRMTKAQAEARVPSGAFAVGSVVAQHRLLKAV